MIFHREVAKFWGKSLAVNRENAKCLTVYGQDIILSLSHNSVEEFLHPNLHAGTRPPVRP